MTEQASSIRGIGQIAINIKDVDRAIAFYRDQLGLSLLFQAGNMAFFDCGGVRLMLGPPSSPDLDHPASILYYRVDDIQAACAELKQKGVQLEREPGLTHKTEEQELWMAFLRDPDNNILALMSEVAI
jgi:methylmalonyl-CoA/ethylmalonyl-CoA epimerase